MSPTQRQPSSRAFVGHRVGDPAYVARLGRPSAGDERREQPDTLITGFTEAANRGRLYPEAPRVAAGEIHALDRCEGFEVPGGQVQRAGGVSAGGQQHVLVHQRREPYAPRGKSRLAEGAIEVNLVFADQQHKYRVGLAFLDCPQSRGEVVGTERDVDLRTDSRTEDAGIGPGRLRGLTRPDVVGGD